MNATYAEIKDYVLKEHGLKVSNLYISQVKRKCGLEVGENYNLAKSEDAKQPNCTEEKEKVLWPHSELSQNIFLTPSSKIICLSCNEIS